MKKTLLFCLKVLISTGVMVLLKKLDIKYWNNNTEFLFIANIIVFMIISFFIDYAIEKYNNN